MVPAFRNEALTDFTRPEARVRMEEALARVEARLGGEYPLIIGGRPRNRAEAVVSRDPCAPDRTVGRVARASRQDAEDALQAAWAAYADWRRAPAGARARILWRAASIMRRRKSDLAAWEVFEVAKTWAEADADVAEAIDFLEYYGRQMADLAGPRLLCASDGEENELTYLPLGAGLVVPPWNFPLAITTGMTAAAIVTGNTVVLKPSSVAPVVAAQLVDVLREAGLPPGVVNLLPGPGAEVGGHLVSHPRTRFVCFTGSREVGTAIHAAAGQVAPGQRWLRRVVAEMGGKDAIIVDEDADLDAAAAAVVASAFGFQGQKCSACSRLIGVGRAYRPLVDLVAERTAALRMGPARDPRTDVAAVASADQHRRILDYVRIGRGEGRLVCGGAPGDTSGYYVQPTIFADVAAGARIAREEIFGPVLACTPADTFEAALALANDSEYGLTGGVFSRSRAHLERAREGFDVGNLYFNRKCTGALVGAQPFGGFRMSGTDSKAGGPDYLLLFTQAKVVTERF